MEKHNPELNCDVLNNILTETGLTQCDYIDFDSINELKPTKNDLSVMQLNIRGLLNKQDQLNEIINECQADAILLCETWLKKQTECLVKESSYKLYSIVRRDKLGGGVGILIHKNLRTRLRPDLHVETTHFEHVVVELKTDTHNILLVSGYRPPHTKEKLFLQEYKKLTNTLKKLKNHEIIIGLDHNLDLMKAQLHTHTNTFLENNLEHDLVPCITKPTRVTRKTATLIDNILLSQKLQNEANPKIIIDNISDHFPIPVLLPNQKKAIKEPKLIKIRKLNETTMEQIKQGIDYIDWNNKLAQLTANESFNLFHDHLCEQINTFAPEIEKKQSSKKITRDPWITKGIRNSLRKQRQLYKKHISLDKSVSTYNYKEYRNALKSLIRKSKKQYLHEKCVQFKQDSRKLWQLVNKVIGKTSNKRASIDCLKVNNILKYDPGSITKEFSEFFSTIGEKYANSMENNSHEINNYLHKIENCPRTMYLTPTTIPEIKSLIKNLPPKTSSGCDDISNTLLKKLAPALLEPLTIIFNKSLIEGTFPERMKLADVVPLFKTKDQQLPTNYRPISMLLTISKLLEKVMYTRTYNFLEITGQLYQSQYGFRKGHSCENAVSELVSSIIKGKQEGHYTIATFIDLSKAFDTLEHGVLLEKLNKYGIRGLANEWYKSYLKNRKLRVKCPVSSTGRIEYSDYKPVRYGTPQGSCLGPLIFLIFTNDLHKQLEHCTSILFADDTTLYNTHRNLRYLTWTMEQDLEKLVSWFKANKLTLNTEKTVCMLFQKPGKNEQIHLTIDKVTLQNQRETKFLGLWLDDQLSWKSHIQKLLLKLNRNSNLLRYSQHLIPESTKMLIYHAHIESHIQYGLLLWGNNVQKDQINKLQKIQTKCMKYITTCKGNPHTRTRILPIKSLISLVNYKFGYQVQRSQLPKKIMESTLKDSKKTSSLPNHVYNMRNKRFPNLPKKMTLEY